MGKSRGQNKGEISADFLPVTSDRSNFVIDFNEYQEVSMMKETKNLRFAYNRQSRLLKDAFAEE